MITWRRVTEADFPTLAGWLANPHVARWWNHEFTLDAVRRDFGPVARGEEPAEDFLALSDGDPVGLVQRCRLGDYPDELAEFAAATDTPPTAVTIDYLVGDPADTGRGLGPEIIRSMLARTWPEYPDAPCVMVAVVAANRPSWRALEKAGLRRVAEAEMTPDNPVDDPLHYVYRIDRPAG